VGDLTAGIEQAPLAGAGQMLLRGSKVPSRRRHRLRRVGTRDHAAIVSGLLSGKFALIQSESQHGLRAAFTALAARIARCHRSRPATFWRPSGAGLLQEVVSTMEA
jgi:hypothetical protein